MAVTRGNMKSAVLPLGKVRLDASYGKDRLLSLTATKHQQRPESHIVDRSIQYD